MSNLRESFEKIVSDVECMRLYGHTSKELEEQLTWMSYVIEQVRAETGTQMTIEDIAIVIKEFGKRIKEVEEQNG